ncbi:MAG TPA: glycosyltransferase family 2 protein [Aquella sp.]|nr:glycosyltransferase family 2 protein [Aquella sp.]
MISVIIPTNNSGLTLSISIESILNQKYGDFEILIIDNNSSDNTVDIANNFRDERISVYVENDKGIFDAMNKGIGRAKGEWIYFLGSDDKFYNDCVLLEISKYFKNQCVVYGNVKISGNTSWSTNGQIYDGPFSLEKLLNKNICHQAIFYNKLFLKENNVLFNINYRLCADWDFNLKCRSLTNFLFADLIIAEFNAGGLSTLSSADDLFSREMVSNLISYFNLSPYNALINTPNYFKYQQVLQIQKRNNFARYFFNRLFKGKDIKSKV